MTSNVYPYTKVYAISPQEGQTRLCLDPWGKAFVRVNGDVHLCCYGTNVGNLRDGTLEEILNNERAMAYRKDLLTGNLKAPCKGCGNKKVCSIIELKELVADYYENGTYFE